MTHKWSFFLDIGATDHLLTEDTEKYMIGIKKRDKEVIIPVANGDTLKVCKKGGLKLPYGNAKINFDALTVPNLTYNLLSVKKINEKGNKIHSIKKRIL